MMVSALVGVMWERWECFLVAGVLGIFIWDARSTLAEVNIGARRVIWKRQGWFGGPLGTGSWELGLDEIKSFRLVRHVGRYEDSFSVEARRASDDRPYPLVGSLTFVQCHQVGEHLRRLLGSEFPITAVD